MDMKQLQDITVHTR